ncbi:MAG: diguanylate cyclase [Candidatus Sericytochromatia bacterium]|nr:diguanylate cyclase [Candidatus Sericytochromatia bacterium]
MAGDPVRGTGTPAPAPVVSGPWSRRYFVAVTSVGWLLAAGFLADLIWKGEALRALSEPLLLLFLALGLFSESFQISLPRGGRMSPSFAVFFSCLLEHGPFPTLLVIFAGGLGAALFQARPLAAGLFNTAQYVLATVGAHLVLTAGGHVPAAWQATSPGVFAVAALVFVGLNAVLVDGYFAIERRQSLWTLLWRDDRWEFIFTLLQAPIAIMVPWLLHTYAWQVSALVLVPFLASTILFLQVIRSRQIRRELAERNTSLAEAVEGLDRTNRQLARTNEDLDAANHQLARTISDLDGANRELRVLHGVASAISGSTDLAETLREIGAGIRQVFDPGACLLILGDKESGELAPVDLDGLTPAEGTLPEGWVLRVANLVQAREDVLLIEDLRESELGEGLPPGMHASLLAAPIRTDEGFAGLLCLLDPEPAAFSPREGELLATLAAHATFAIRKAQLYQATQLLAITDGLTGVYNRRYLQRQLESELRRASRLGHGTSVVLLDVDFFKAFNDSHGHLLGDQVLRSLAQVLRDSVRETDVVARYGGEEFAVILPETPLEAAMAVVARFRTRLRQHPFWGRSQTPVQVTVSIGLSHHVTSRTTADELLDRADQALYAAKHGGRDRVFGWDSEAESPLQMASPEAGSQPRQPIRQSAVLDRGRWASWLAEGVAPAAQRCSQAMRLCGAVGQMENTAEVLAGQARQLLLLRLEAGAAEAGDPEEAVAFYQALRAEAVGWLTAGISLTQAENVILVLLGAFQEHVRHGPFSPQDKLIVLSGLEWLSRQSMLALSLVWHESYQQANRDLLLLERMDRVTGGLDPWLEQALDVLREAFGGLPVLLMAREPDGMVLRARSGGDGVWRVPADVTWPEGLATADAAFTVSAPFGVGEEARGELMPQALVLPLRHEGQLLGAVLVGLREGRRVGSRERRLARTVAGRVASALGRALLEERRHEAYLSAIGELVGSLEAQDGYEQGHAHFLEHLTAEMGRRLGLPDGDLEALALASRFHDLGKVAVPPQVLHKPGTLTPEERAVVEVHPEVGARLLAPVARQPAAVAAIRHHHERFDGTGYPAGLAGEQIPLLARILAVAEAWDGMTSPKAWRPALPPDLALADMRTSGHFDPALLDALAGMLDAGALIRHGRLPLTGSAPVC